MILIDDLLLRTLGLSLKPFDLIWIMELMKDYALKEKYNMKKITAQIKENNLLFEIGEISEEEYNEQKELLTERLTTAKQIMENLSEVQIREIE
ncbi:MAG: gas vesicle protein GvpG [Nanoarchaeota archaeon]|nr:gas vesicle protein GvpG [Nanoarchaeota archaeon]